MPDKDIYLILKYKDKEFTLLKDMTFWVNGSKLYKAEKFIVPAGIKTDFASIPLILQVFLSKINASIAIPSILHDYLYDNHLTSRKYADYALYEKCLSFKMNKFTALLVYYAVRIVGWYGWKNSKKIWKK